MTDLTPHLHTLIFLSSEFLEPALLWTDEGSQIARPTCHLCKSHADGLSLTASFEPPPRPAQTLQNLFSVYFRKVGPS